ncbi:MAG: PTS sugar transporter subunit IIA [Trichloromonadaceae bacterium]
MIGLVIATHANLGSEILLATEMIIGTLSQAKAVGIRKEDSVEEIRAAVTGAIDTVSDNQGVIIMTDMFGGTPSNISLAFLEPDRVEVLTGVNLPMVLKFFNSQEGLSLAELALLLQSYGQQGITLPSQFLNR